MSLLRMGWGYLMLRGLGGFLDEPLLGKFPPSYLEVVVVWGVQVL